MVRRVEIVDFGYRRDGDRVWESYGVEYRFLDRDESFFGLVEEREGRIEWFVVFGFEFEGYLGGD